MITTSLAANKTEFRNYLEQLKVKSKRIFSPDEVEYLANNDGFEAVELKQENETDDEFLKLFSTSVQSSRATLTTTSWSISVLRNS